MANLAKVGYGVLAIRGGACPALALLPCVSNHPADPTDARFLAMATMRESFDLPIGISDHALGIGIALAAVTLDAAVVE